MRFPIFKQHGYNTNPKKLLYKSPHPSLLPLEKVTMRTYWDWYNLLKIVVEFIECFALGTGTGKTRNTTDKQSRLATAFDYRRVNFHNWPPR
jgi:hypothetical protein